jgi:hypothetical protein
VAQTQGPSGGQPYDPATHNDETHILCADGLVYERRVVKAVGVAAGFHVNGEEKTPLNKRLEAAMTKAVEDAIAEGLTLDDKDEVDRRIHEARDRVLVEDAHAWVSSQLNGSST